MTSGELVLGDVAEEVRSKNAGPFWMTLDVFFETDTDYDFVVNCGVISNMAVSDVYKVDEGTVKIFFLPNIRAIKLSFPRPIFAGNFGDRDLHAGQQHVPLANLRIPARAGRETQ